MSVKILNGFTNTRHITPYMDAALNRGIFGEADCILSTGNQLAASMPDINTFVLQDGAFSIQGHIGICDGQTLTVDTCASGMNRVDLVCARFTHNTETKIDDMAIVLIKGEETSSAYPTNPTYNTGVIAEGAPIVDAPLYKITLSGSEVTFQRLQYVHASDIWNYGAGTDLVRVKGSSHDTGFDAIRTDTGVSTFFGVGAGGVNHGIWSRKNNHWMIYEDANGIARISSNDLRVGGHSSSIGSIVQAWNTSAKTCKSGTWYALCSIVLDAGVWIIEAGARWNADTSNPRWYGQRVANISSQAGNTSCNVSVGAPDNSAITQVRWSEVYVLTASTRLYLNAAHGCGHNIVMPASSGPYGSFLRAVRIK